MPPISPQHIPKIVAGITRSESSAPSSTALSIAHFAYPCGGEQAFRACTRSVGASVRLHDPLWTLDPHIFPLRVVPEGGAS